MKRRTPTNIGRRDLGSERSSGAIDRVPASLSQCLLALGSIPEMNIQRWVEWCGLQIGAQGTGYFRASGRVGEAVARWRLPANASVPEPEVLRQHCARTPGPLESAPSSPFPRLPAQTETGARAGAWSHWTCVPVRLDGAVPGYMLVLSGARRTLTSTQSRVLELVARMIAIEERRASEVRRLRDIETKLLEVQKLESLGVLTRGVAHDFNNLLTAIVGNACLAARELPSRSPVRIYLEQVENTCNQAADLCRQLLNYSRPTSFSPQRVQLNHLLTDMRHLLRLSVCKSVLLQYELAPDLAPVEADLPQLRQVIMNLVINASEALGCRAGEVRVRTGHLQTTSNWVSNAVRSRELPVGQYVFLEVTDNGCGMPPDIMSRIFEPFYTTKPTGCGLGLATVRDIAERHQGAVVVSSDPDRGSSFRFLLPARPESVDSTISATPRATTWKGSGVVLVADDDDSVRWVVGRALQLCGFETIEARNGVQAVELFRQHSDRLTAVLLDFTMPELNGRDALAQMRLIRANVPTILMSGHSESEARDEPRLGGADAFLQKPFQLDELRETLRGLCEARAS